MSTNPRAHRPAPPGMPHAVTFFLTAQERAAVIRELRKRHKRRADALLLALGLGAHEGRGARP